jgi:hypothetical protein
MTLSEALMGRRQAADGRGDLSPWLTMALPLAFLVLAFGSRAVSEELYRRVVMSETGIVENATVILLIPAILAGIAVFAGRGRLPWPWIGWWALLLAVAALYFAGEEASWGQHWFGWGTPDWVGTLNDQGETNLHNMSSWLDQKPRIVLLTWVLVGGIVVPLWFRRRRFDPRVDWRAWFWPTMACVPPAVLGVLVHLLDVWRDDSGLPMPALLRVRNAELQELFFACFVLFYLGSLWVRLSALAPERR